VAMLSGGRMIEEPPPGLGYDSGNALRANHFGGFQWNCGGGVAIVGPGRFGVQMQGEMTNCRQDIDGILFHDSTFTDSRLTYVGAAPLIFPDTNVVTDTALELGPRVDLNDEKVIHLVCGFPWKAVYQDSKELKLSCPAHK
jgi:hypothetical protein